MGCRVWRPTCRAPTAPWVFLAGRPPPRCVATGGAVPSLHPHLNMVGRGGRAFCAAGKVTYAKPPVASQVLMSRLLAWRPLGWQSPIFQGQGWGVLRVPCPGLPRLSTLAWLSSASPT